MADQENGQATTALQTEAETPRNQPAATKRSASRERSLTALLMRNMIAPTPDGTGEGTPFPVGIEVRGGQGVCAFAVRETTGDPGCQGSE